MKVCRDWMRLALWAALVLVVSGGEVKAGLVVYGNLGPSGTAALSGAYSAVGSGAMAAIAQGFTPSGLRREVTSISLGVGPLFSSSATSRLSIYPDNGGVPGSFALYNSTGSVTVTSDAVYTWNFSNAHLTSGSTYWVYPDGDLKWYQVGSYDSPSAQNSSGYSYAGTIGSFAGPWGPTSAGYSISVEAVPEPSTWCMALAGLACGGVSLWRRGRSSRSR